jgi:ribosomal protein S18 acetylase RimI-like enzyme
MNAAVADAQSMNCKRLLLGTNQNNQRAVAFYRRNGFTEAGTRTFQVGSQCCCDLIFARPLD